jgi:hypothetical protein
LYKGLLKPPADNAGSVSKPLRYFLVEYVFSDKYVRFVETHHGPQGGGPGEAGIDFENIGPAVYQPALNIDGPGAAESQGHFFADFRYFRKRPDLPLGDAVANGQNRSEFRAVGAVGRLDPVAQTRT